MNFFRSKRGRLAAIAGAVLLLASLSVAYVRLFGDIFSGLAFSGTWLDRDGQLLRIFLTDDEKYRERMELSQFPLALREAVLLQEDRYFYAHGGINPGALAKAAWETYVKKNRRMGASTITMQLARLKYGLHTSTLPGKINQIVRAVALDLCYSKNDILEAYLNLAPCGGNLEGFPAAARYYFGTSVDRLDLSQLLLLAVIPQDPTERAPSPDNVPKETLAARETLFSAWLSDHPEDADRSSELSLGVEVLCHFPFDAPHFTGYMESRREGRRGAKSAKAIRTTIDARMQTLCEESLSRYVEQNLSFGIKNGAVLLADWTTMEILASVGSANWADDSIQGQVNGTTAKRSPGSTLKPFIYALALEQGLIHSETMLKDTPVSFNEYTPDNFGSDFAGPVPAYKALVDSRNIPAIALARDLKESDLYAFLANAGISGLKAREHYGLSIVLGSAEVSMLELAKLYGALAAGGILREPVMTLKSGAERAGDVAAPGSANGKRVLTTESAYITRKMLEENTPPYETRPATSKGVPVAFKTGTSIGFKDCWSCAIFDRYVLIVWMGNFDGQGNNSFQGRTMATPLLFRIVDSVLAGLPEKDRLGERERPENVSRIPVCSVSGGIPGDECPDTTLAWFIPGVSPITGCKIHRRISIDTRTGYRTDETPDETTGSHIISEVREFWPTDLLELFSQAGLPRLVPPPYPPGETRYDNKREGYPPSIISPLANTNYILRAENDNRRAIVLTAAADADANELFWFADTLFVGRSSPSGKILWKAEPGTHTVTVVDQKGRSTSVRLTVSAGE
jgi:penicillin-binding protein 1C